MKEGKKKLILNRETIRSLTERELEDVNAASGGTCVNSNCCCETSMSGNKYCLATEVAC